MKLSRNLSILLLIIANIAADQISKVLVRANFEYREIKHLIGDTLIMQYVNNKGAFLGMWSEMDGTLRLVLLILLPVMVLGYLIYYIISNKTLDKLSTVALSCIAGGGIANIFDRIAFGEVTDFFLIDLGGVFRTGIFNVADMSVTFGMIGLIYAWAVATRQQKKAL